MRVRVALLALTSVLAVVAASCAGCGRPSSQPTVEIRWPATAAVPQIEALRRDEQLVETPEAPLTATEVAPGVRVREGAAHDLSYIEVVLGDADFDDPLPLVVLLHGRGDRPRVPGGPFGRVSIPMRLIMPRGPLRLGAGFAWVLPSVTQGRHDLLAAALRRRTHHLAALIATLSKTLPTLGRPVVAGFSQGALLAFSLALHRPDVVGQALPLVGWVPPELMPALPIAPDRRVPIRALHGTEDAVIPVGPTREVVERLRALEWDVEFLEFEAVGHVVSRDMNITFETWLEEALLEQAPALAGRGPRVIGPEIDGYEPWEPLEPETIEAIEQYELQGPELPPDTSEGGPAQEGDDAPAGDDRGDDTPDDRSPPRGSGAAAGSRKPDRRRALQPRRRIAQSVA